jgi:hypothetical protein
MDEDRSPKLQLTDTYVSRLPYMDELGYDIGRCYVDFDRLHIYLRTNSGRECIVTFEEVADDFDSFLVKFARADDTKPFPI